MLCWSRSTSERDLRYGPLVAAANSKDPQHEACVELIHTAFDIVVPGPVVAEAGFLIAKAGGPMAETMFIRSLASPRYDVASPTKAELQRAAELVGRYGDLPLGTTDAIVMAMVESRSDPRVATLDRRHFSVVRPARFDSFELRPE